MDSQRGRLLAVLRHIAVSGESGRVNLAAKDEVNIQFTMNTAQIRRLGHGRAGGGARTCVLRRDERGARPTMAIARSKTFRQRIDSAATAEVRSPEASTHTTTRLHF